MTPPRRFVIRERRQLGGGRDQERLLGKFREQRGLEQAVLAAAEGGTAAGAADRRARNVEVAIRDLDPKGLCREPSRPISFQGVCGVLQELQPELPLRCIQPDRQVHLAGPEQQPMRMEADQEDIPPKPLRDPRQVDRMRKRHREMGISV